MNSQWLVLLLCCFIVCKTHGQTLSAAPIEEFTITFDQITPTQHAQIRGFYTQYSAYKKHSITTQNADSTIITYQSGAPIALLLNNFSKTAEHLGMEVLIRSANANISIRLIQQKPKQLPYKEW